MGFPDPPQDGKTSSWMAWGFVVLCVAIGWGIFTSLGGKVTRAGSSNPDPNLKLPSAGDEPGMEISTRGMTPDMVGALAKVSGTLASVVATNSDLEARVTKLETTQTDLVNHIVHLHKGISNGTIPPLPELAENIKHLFHGLL